MIHTEERSIHSLTCTFCYWFFKQKYNLIWKTFIRRNLLHSFLRSFAYLLACLLACYFFAFLLGKRTQFTRTQTNPQTFWFNPNIIGSVVSSSFVSYFRPFWYFFSLRLFIAIHIRVYPISPSCWVHIAQHIAHCNIIIVTCVLAIAAAATSLVYIGQILLIHLFVLFYSVFFWTICNYWPLHFITFSGLTCTPFTPLRTQTIHWAWKKVDFSVCVLVENSTHSILVWICISSDLT